MFSLLACQHLHHQSFCKTIFSRHVPLSSSGDSAFALKVGSIWTTLSSRIYLLWGAWVWSSPGSPNPSLKPRSNLVTSDQTSCGDLALLQLLQLAHLLLLHQKCSLASNLSPWPEFNAMLALCQYPWRHSNQDIKELADKIPKNLIHNISNKSPSFEVIQDISLWLPISLSLMNANYLKPPTLGNSVSVPQPQTFMPRSAQDPVFTCVQTQKSLDSAKTCSCGYYRCGLVMHNLTTVGVTSACPPGSRDRGGYLCKENAVCRDFCRMTWASQALCCSVQRVADSFASPVKAALRR